MVARGSTVLDIHLLQGDHRLGAILDAEFAEDGGDMGLMVASETLSSQAICLLRLPSRSMISTLYCWGGLASLLAKSGPSTGSGWRETPSGTQLSPRSPY